MQCRLLEGLLNAFLKIYPLSLPELQYLGDCSGSTSTSKINLPKEMGEEKGISSNKRQKSSKDKAASDKLNPDDKLKQPAILDAFKRVGVTVSQATNKASSQPSSSGMMSKDIEQEVTHPVELGLIDLMAAPVQLDMQRFKFRTLHATCLSLLNYLEVCTSSV
jgi:Fanconi anemia group D2 protein